MLGFSPLIQALMEALRCLPGVGPKSAQRMALDLLTGDRAPGLRLATVLQSAMERVQACQRCKMLSEQSLCGWCRTPGRDGTRLCVVESVANALAIDHSTDYRGLYFVLSGNLSPIDGRGPEEIGLPLLIQRLKEGEVTEVILAMNPSIEGAATAYYITEISKSTNTKVTRLAQGVPMGSDLSYIDSTTLAHAFTTRDLLKLFCPLNRL